MKQQHIAAALSALIFMLSAAGCGTSFSPEDWKAADQLGRQKMARSLMREYDIVGWTESDVLLLLGPETSAEPDFRYSIPEDTADTLVYSLGEAKYCVLRLLVVTLDENRTVTKWELVDHSM
jgi:hypothetical protein